MKSGPCPKCSSSDIRVIAQHRQMGGSIAIGLVSSAAVDHHVCVVCGYTEMYVSDPGDLAQIAAKWPLAEG